MNQYAKRIQLPHGVQFAPEQSPLRPVYGGVTHHLKTHTHKLVAPVGEVKEVTLRCATMGEVIRTIVATGREHVMGTRAYNDSLAQALIRAQATHDLPADFFDKVAYVDLTELTHYVNRGTHLTGPRAGEGIFHTPGLEELEGYTNVAYVRLHGNSDRKIATGNMPDEDNPVLFEAYLAHLLVSFGEEPDFDRRAERIHFESITWPDFQRITAEVYARDYEPLAELLEGRVKTGDSEVPFLSVPEEGAKLSKGSGKARKPVSS